MKICKAILLLLFLSFQAKSQNNISSSTYIQTFINGVKCYSINNSSFIYYDENTHTIFLKLDFNKFKTSVDTIDEWLVDLTDTYLYYKAPLTNDFYLGLGKNGHKQIKLNGWIFMNGVWKEKRIDLNIIAGLDGSFTQTNNQNHYDNYKLNFSFSFLPKEFKVDKKPHHLKKAIEIAVSMGRMNLIQPGMGSLILGEAYTHNP
jgi:hypothetical protein